MSKPTQPFPLAAEAMQLANSLAQRGVSPDLMEREISAVISGWIDAGRVGALDALRGQLELAADVAAADARNLAGEYAPGLRHAERTFAGLEAARDVVKAAVAQL